jgi:hypothetical protein
MKDAKWWDEIVSINVETRRVICEYLKKCERGFCFLTDAEKEVMREANATDNVEWLTYYPDTWQIQYGAVEDKDTLIHRIRPDFRPPVAEPESEWDEYEVRLVDGRYRFFVPGQYTEATFAFRESLPGYGGTMYETSGMWTYFGIPVDEHGIMLRPLKVRYRKGGVA